MPEMPLSPLLQDTDVEEGKKSLPPPSSKGRKTKRCSYSQFIWAFWFFVLVRTCQREKAGLEMKKMRKVPAEAAPLVYPAVGEDARARFKLQSLVQDYEDLVKETETMRTRLQARRQQKSKLSAEVKFLRQKYKSLLKNKTQFQNTLYVPKPQYQKPKPLKKPSKRASTIFANQPSNPEIPNPSILQLKDRKHREHEAAVPSTSAVLDLNQISIPSGDEEDFQVGWEPLRVEKSLKQCPVEADPTSCDLKVSVCRDVGNGASRAGKRKISWQDQVALRV